MEKNKYRTKRFNQKNFYKSGKSKAFLEVQKPVRLASIKKINPYSFELNEFGSTEQEHEEKSNYLSQIFEGARVTFDVNKENLKNKISNIIRKKEKENRKLEKKKYKRWSKVKGLLNFFLIMRSELFKRKIQGLTNLSSLPNKKPLQ